MDRKRAKKGVDAEAIRASDRHAGIMALVGRNPEMLKYLPYQTPEMRKAACEADPETPKHVGDKAPGMARRGAGDLDAERHQENREIAHESLHESWIDTCRWEAVKRSLKEMIEQALMEMFLGAMDKLHNAVDSFLDTIERMKDGADERERIGGTFLAGAEKDSPKAELPQESAKPPSGPRM